MSKPGYSQDPWWVAENLTNQNSFRLSNFFSSNAPSGYQAVHAGSIADWNAFQSAKATRQPVSLHNITWQVVGGPYATQSHAEAAIQAIQAITPAPGAASQAASGVGLGGALSGAGGFFGALTQANTWIRVAKVGIGGALLIIGLAHMTGASNAIATTARKVPLPL